MCPKTQPSLSFHMCHLSSPSNFVRLISFEYGNLLPPFLKYAPPCLNLLFSSCSMLEIHFSLFISYIALRMCFYRMWVFAFGRAGCHNIWPFHFCFLLWLLYLQCLHITCNALLFSIMAIICILLTCQMQHPWFFGHLYYKS